MIFERVHAKSYAPYANLPGPSPIFPFGNALDFIGKTHRPWEVFASYGERFGGKCVAWLFGTPILVLNDADLIGDVLCRRTVDFYKDEPGVALIPVLTRSSPNINNGAEWTRTRTQSPMTQPWIGHWLEAQLSDVRGLLEGWFERMETMTAAQTIPLQAKLQRITFDSFSVGAVGSVLSDKMYEDFMALASQGSKRMTSSKPKPELGAVGQSTRKRFLSGLGKYYDAASANPNDGPSDLLSLALRHHSRLPREELAAEMGNVFYGGCFSVPSTLVSALYLLSSHPAEAKKVIAAVRDLDDDFDLKALNSCEQLDFALREAMRLLPAVPMFFRRVLATKPTEFAGCQLPADANILICNWRLQRAEPQWPRPMEYLPDRWSGGVANERPLGSDYFFPEGRGPRMCLGAEYSIFFMKLFLATALRRWDIECGKGQNYDAGQTYFFGVRMPMGVKARIRRR